MGRDNGKTQPTYIHDQRWSICTDWENPWPWLASNYFRAGRPKRGAGMPGMEGEEQEKVAWEGISFAQVIKGRFTVPGDDGNPNETVDLHRVVITTDAGLGKTVATKAIEYHVGARSSNTLAIRMKLKDLANIRRGELSQTQAIVAKLADQLLKKMGSDEVTHTEVTRLINRKRRSGDLVLIFDGLDEAGKIGELKAICGGATLSPDWEKVRVIIAGRPYSVRNRRSDLFNGGPWRFLCLEEFTQPQIDRYLGARSDGTRRIAKLTGCEEILGVPRVLEYLRYVDDEDLELMTRPADIYYAAVQHLLQRGFAKSKPARLLGTDFSMGTELDEPHANNLPKAFELLGLIAYEMTCVQIENSDSEVPETEDPYAVVEKKYGPNFAQIPTPELTTKDFIKRVKLRYNYDENVGFDHDLECLASLNQVLQQGVFDSESTSGFQMFQFRNRSLQEFFCAHYLATHATSEQKDEDQSDQARLWDWIYLPFEPETEAYYHIWQFLCDMPRRVNGDNKLANGAIAKNWLTAIKPLFLRGKDELDEQGQPKRVVKRSSEMIFRCWRQLDADCAAENNQARSIMRHWITEFEELLNLPDDDFRNLTAKGIVNGFIRLPGTKETGETFIMGTSPDKQGSFDQKHWEQELAQLQSFARKDGKSNGIIRYINQYPALQFLSDSDPARLAWISFAAELLEAGTTEPARRQFGRKDEGRQEMEINSFQLARATVSHGEFRLFCPTHGNQESYQQCFGKHASLVSEDQHPVIFVSWYDCFCYSKWLRWDNLSCCMPQENQWEYACKFGSPWDWRYWWSDDQFEHCFANAENKVGRPQVPSVDHASQATRDLDPEKIGLMDMLGNVSEWCADQYRPKFSCKSDDIPVEPSLSRVLRGGSFITYAVSCRSSCRLSYWPQSAFRDGGFRVSRA